MEALGVLDWWREAGVDTIVDDVPRDWLRPPAKAAAPAQAAPVAAALPDTLAGLHVWLREAPTLPGAPASRVLPSGDPASGIMILADMPEAGDASALFAGDAGRLFDRMLAAIGRDRGSVYLAPMAGARVTRQEIEAPECVRLARHHVALAAPRLLVLIGDAPCAAMLDTGFAAARGIVHRVNLNDTSVAAIATFPPRMLLRQPARKADAWADMLLILETMDA